jgi:hypothetical protein
MGIDQIDDAHITWLRQQIPAVSRHTLQADEALAPAWMHARLRHVYELKIEKAVCLRASVPPRALLGIWDRPAFIDHHQLLKPQCPLCALCETLVIPVVVKITPA